MPFYRVFERQVIQRVFYVKADSEKEAESVAENTDIEDAIFDDTAECKREVTDGPFDTLAELEEALG